METWSTHIDLNSPDQKEMYKEAFCRYVKEKVLGHYDADEGSHQFQLFDFETNGDYFPYKATVATVHNWGEGNIKNRVTLHQYKIRPVQQKGDLSKVALEIVEKNSFDLYNADPEKLSAIVNSLK